MPFKSDSQRRLCYLLKGKGQAGSWDCDEWSTATGKKDLPEHVEDQTEKEASGLSAVKALCALWSIPSPLKEAAARSLLSKLSSVITSPGRGSGDEEETATNPDSSEGLQMAKSTKPVPGKMSLNQKGLKPVAPLGAARNAVRRATESELGFDPASKVKRAFSLFGPGPKPVVPRQQRPKKDWELSDFAEEYPEYPELKKLNFQDLYRQAEQRVLTRMVKEHFQGYSGSPYAGGLILSKQADNNIQSTTSGSATAPKAAAPSAGSAPAPKVTATPAPAPTPAPSPSPSLKSIGTGVVNAGSTAFQSMYSPEALERLQAMGNRPDLPAMANNVSNYFKGTGDVSKTMNGWADKAIDYGVNSFTGYDPNYVPKINSFNSRIPDPYELLNNAKGKVSNLFQAKAKGIKDTAANYTGGVVQGLGTMATNIGNTARKVPGVATAIDKVKDVGRGMQQGMYNAAGQYEAERRTAGYALPVVNFMQNNPWAKYLVGALGTGAVGYGLNSMFGGQQKQQSQAGSVFQQSYNQGLKGS